MRKFQNYNNMKKKSSLTFSQEITQQAQMGTFLMVQYRGIKKVSNSKMMPLSYLNVNITVSQYNLV
jgi:hypothetical protein